MVHLCQDFNSFQRLFFSFLAKYLKINWLGMGRFLRLPIYLRIQWKRLLNILAQNEKNETFFITYSHISCINITHFKGANVWA